MLFDKTKASAEAQAFKKKIERAKRIDIGRIAPEFSQADTAGKIVSFSSFRGKYVLIDFWASWCKPCREESPILVKSYERFRDQGFNILSISLDKSQEKWIEAIKKDRLSWTHLSDLQFWQNEIVLQYGIGGLPYNFLLNRDGRIIEEDSEGSN